MELAVSKMGQKVCHRFVLRYKNIKIVNSVQVQVARTHEGVNILSNLHPFPCGLVYAINTTEVNMFPFPILLVVPSQINICDNLMEFKHFCYFLVFH